MPHKIDLGSPEWRGKPSATSQIRKELLQEIKEGNLKLRDLLLSEQRLKVWTNEELKALNYFLKVESMNERKEAIRLTEERYIDIPTFLDPAVTEQHRINWLRDIGEGYFEAGLTSVRHGGGSVWLLLLDKKEGFRPLFCPSHFQKKEE